MRVIAGQFRSRRLKSVPGLDTRPTPDRLREALFGVLTPRIEGTVFVDAYAGTGAVGIEALSRGANRAIFIERNRAALAVLRENLTDLDLMTAAHIVTGKMVSALSKYPADIVFLDPPYESEREYETSMEVLGREATGLVIVQHSVKYELAGEWGRLRRVRLLRQGDNALSFFEPEASEPVRIML
jgi:16S rRNA (guanine(966)-N(2))-methyltransferase RsmD